MKARFESSLYPRRRRRLAGPIILVALVVGFVALLGTAWHRGGEQAIHPVEITVPANQLGQAR